MSKPTEKIIELSPNEQVEVRALTLRDQISLDVFRRQDDGRWHCVEALRLDLDQAVSIIAALALATGDLADRKAESAA
jgi:hypothetical protein